MAKGKAFDWTADELAWIEVRKDWPRVALHDAFQTEFNRDASFHNLDHLCRRKGWMLGHVGKPIGSERINAAGYRDRKIHDGLPRHGRWRAVHVIEWEAVNGPLPANHCLRCLDGNKLNTAPTNWECIPKAITPRLNGSTGRLAYAKAAPELRPTILAVARLEHAVRCSSNRGAKINMSQNPPSVENEERDIAA